MVGRWLSGHDSPGVHSTEGYDTSCFREGNTARRNADRLGNLVMHRHARLSNISLMLPILVWIFPRVRRRRARDRLFLNKVDGARRAHHQDTRAANKRAVEEMSDFEGLPREAASSAASSAFGRLTNDGADVEADRFACIEQYPSCWDDLRNHATVERCIEPSFVTKR